MANGLWRGAGKDRRLALWCELSGINEFSRFRP
jgi:hypothetical protein